MLLYIASSSNQHTWNYIDSVIGILLLQQCCVVILPVLKYILCVFTALFFFFHLFAGVDNVYITLSLNIISFIFNISTEISPKFMGRVVFFQLFPHPPSVLSFNY